MIERIIFFTLALGFFMFLFFKMIKKNDTNYLYLLIIQAIGIAISFISLIARIQLNIVLTIFTYIISVIMPLVIIIVEFTKISLTEAIHLIIARYYMKAGRPEDARKMLLKLVEKEPNSYYGHKELAKQYDDEEKYDQALDEYLRVNEIRPGEDDINFKIADLFNKTRKPEESINILHELIKRKPEWEEATFLLGDIYYDQEMFKEAISLYLNALKYHPENYDLYYNLGMCFTRINDFQSAREYYTRAAELNSLLFKAKYNLGQIALLYNELDEAEERFTECLQDEELEDYAYYYLACIAMLRGDEAKAIAYLNTAVGENPDIYETIKKEDVFKLILYKIDKPNKDGQVKKKRPKTKIDKKDKKTMKHLKKMYELVGDLNNNDVKVMHKIMDKRQKEEKAKEENNR